MPGAAQHRASGAAARCVLAGGGAAPHSVAHLPFETWKKESVKESTNWKALRKESTEESTKEIAKESTDWKAYLGFLFDKIS